MELLDLAQNYFGDTRSGSLAGPLGGFLVAVLLVFTVLLIRNMNARIRRLPERFPASEAGEPGESVEATGAETRTPPRTTPSGASPAD
ncbi:MAG TPA: hypothetical protein VKZ74_05365 [Natronosporangium sp.]|nr:hypothetical protein [Natronosporangium sp.]